MALDKEQYQFINSSDREEQSYKKEEGKKWRQFLAAVLCKRNKIYFLMCIIVTCDN